MRVGVEAGIEMNNSPKINILLVFFHPPKTCADVFLPLIFLKDLSPHTVTVYSDHGCQTPKIKKETTKSP